jgi:hypothetical protein
MAAVDVDRELEVAATTEYWRPAVFGLGLVNTIADLI